ncbi:MAG: radical SAM family heme chaperone HemW [Ahrensia sp.]|nr:radical SAM family heme chaperone HemW [Ahrensia sp.]
MTGRNNDDGTPGFGIYVHWPFCAAKCPYCDFNSHVRQGPNGGGVDQRRYAQAFERELGHMAQLCASETVTSIFFGGGTPSLMEPATVEHILRTIHDLWLVDEQAEITMEANPSSVETERFRAYRATGVNRVSLGVQSLDDAQLKFLGRLHSAEEAKAAIDIARKTFERMSFDLIYARPQQTLAQWRSELEEAIRLSADHLSLYQLTIEQGTPFFDLHRKGKLSIPDAENAAQLYELTQEITASHGLPAYEISNHAKPRQESRHNLTYWRSGDWVGAGPGAHGRLTRADGRYTTANERVPERWLEAVNRSGHGMVEHHALSLEEHGDEMLLMGLRLREGLEVERYSRETGHELDPARISDLTGHGMVEILPNGRLRATAGGWLVLDAVIADLAA